MEACLLLWGARLCVSEPNSYLPLQKPILASTPQPAPGRRGGGLRPPAQAAAALTGPLVVRQPRPLMHGPSLKSKLAPAGFMVLTQNINIMLIWHEPREENDTFLKTWTWIAVVNAVQPGIF